MGYTTIPSNHHTRINQELYPIFELDCFLACYSWDIEPH